MFYRWRCGLGAVKAARGGTKPERGRGQGHQTRTGKGMAETGRRSRAAGRRCNGSRFWPPAHRVLVYYIIIPTVSLIIGTPSS